MKIYYYAYTNKGNLGDLLITKYQIEEYAKYCDVYVDCHGMPPDFCHVIFDTTSPNIKNFEHEYGIYFRSINIFKIIQILNRQGFTHFCDSPGPRVPLRWPLHRMLIKLARLSIPNFFLSKKIIRISLGVDLYFNHHNIFSRLNKWNFNQNDVLGIRSKPNLAILQNVFRNVCYTPDMAFLYPKYKSCFFESKRNRIALSFKFVKNYDNLIKAIQVLVEFAENHQLEVDILFQVDEDEYVCKKLYQDLEQYHIHFIEKPIDFYSLCTYQKYDVVISNRLHVLLMATMNGAIPLGLISHNRMENKIKDIIDSIFERQLVSYIEDFNEHTLPPIFNNIDIIKKEICACVETQRNLCSFTFANLFQSSPINEK